MWTSSRPSGPSGSATAAFGMQSQKDCNSPPAGPVFLNLYVVCFSPTLSVWSSGLPNTNAGSIWTLPADPTTV